MSDAPLTSSPTPTPRLLVADDEEAILAEYRRIFVGRSRSEAASTARSLEAELFGRPEQAPEVPFDLVTCRQGDEALAAFRRSMEAGDPFPVVYLDVRMPPGPNGVETARAIRALDPHAHIAIITGYSDFSPDEIAELVRPVDRLFYFEKPFRGVELRQLAIALNAKWHVERALENARDNLERQVAERTRELLAAKEAAERANESKTTFLANMSHELRTPLNAVIGFSDLMMQQPHGPLGEKYLEYTRDINQSGRHLLDLINAILDLAKADRGKLTLYRTPFPVADAIDVALRMVQPLAMKCGVALRRSVSPAVGLLYADQTKVLQILTNLLSNAVKFTPEGGRVTVEAGTDAAGMLTIRIIDTGIGIRAEDIPRALEPFVQIDNRRNRLHEGTGLGLPLAVALVELHGGHLGLESTIGKGTTVTLTFPRIEPAAGNAGPSGQADAAAATRPSAA